ncbi:MAG: gamma carbonic anhydrase family protein [Puniceicoccales bacterium]|jgi:carbonic anhydrase/acetyltransferase-like protein (isoleucine patch superfamily)|nr:gamma carbonic anhydrase family protein [Puniceicoccales bacterium]
MTIEERLQKFLSQDPVVAPSAHILPGATVLGAVTLGPKASVFPSAVVRADIERIDIGEGSNIQDGVVVHLSDDMPVKIGKYVTIGHRAMIHACSIEDGCLIGMSSTIIDGAVIGAESIVGAHALVTKNTIIPPRSLVMGVPAKVVRQLTPEEAQAGRKMAEKYTVVSAAIAQKLAGAKA